MLKIVQYLEQTHSQLLQKLQTTNNDETGIVVVVFVQYSNSSSTTTISTSSSSSTISTDQPRDKKISLFNEDE